VKVFDFVIVGAGIVGMTVARELTHRFPKAKIAILEKEPQLGRHASGRNSGVMHCGIYYGSDSLKAKVCSSGAKRMIAYAESQGIAVKRCGKLILATEEAQLPVVEKLMRNAAENQIRASLLDLKQAKEIEPYISDSSVAGIFCPDTAVIDSVSVLQHLKAELEKSRVEFIFECKVIDVDRDGILGTSVGDLCYGYMINCAGAYADQIAKKFGLASDYALVPFKGTYWKLSDGSKHKVRANIYPVPDISMPFLGVHLTRVVSGDVYVGPTSIPAFGRENYGILEGLNLKESFEVGRKMIGMYLENNNNFRKLAHQEVSKYAKKNFLKSAQKLMPSLEMDDLVPTPKVGIRPQLVNLRTKKLEMDYILEHTQNSLHVLNAISPAFTASMSFADLIVDAIGV
jgi:(S)-2-hydroxyglutarate dehydrogenase